MRLNGTFLVTLACAFGMVACEGRDFFEELRPEPVGALNGIYREKTTQAASKDPEAYTELSIEEGNVFFVALNPRDATSEHARIARLSPGEGVSYEMERTEDLAALSSRDDRAGFLASIFAEGSRVRVLRQGNDLKVTEIRGSYRRTTTWEKLETVTTEEGRTVSRSLLKAGLYGLEIQKLRAEFLQHWGADTVEIFERIERKGETVQVTPAAKLTEKDESLTSEEAGSKYSLRLNRLKLISAKEALINDAHPAELRFSLRFNAKTGKNALHLVVASAADPTKYQAQTIMGFVEIDGAGFRLAYVPEKELGYDSLTYRYFPKGTNAPTPTEPPEREVPGPILTAP